MKFELTGFAVLLSSSYSLRITCVPTELKRNMKLTEKIKNGDPWENRTLDYAVRGRRLNRLTKGPWKQHISVLFAFKKEKSRRLPIFPGRLQPSIFGTTKLNFCVRNGNRWNLGVIGTGYECAWSNCLKPSLYIFSFSFWRSYLQNWTTTALSWANAEPSRRLWSSPRPISTR